MPKSKFGPKKGLIVRNSGESSSNYENVQAEEQPIDTPVDDFLMRKQALDKREQQTANAFQARKIENQFAFPPTTGDETKEHAQIRKQQNAKVLGRERQRENRNKKDEEETKKRKLLDSE